MIVDDTQSWPYVALPKMRIETNRSCQKCLAQSALSSFWFHQLASSENRLPQCAANFLWFIIFLVKFCNLIGAIPHFQATTTSLIPSIKKTSQWYQYPKKPTVYPLVNIQNLRWLESPFFNQWLNQLFLNGHVQVRKLFYIFFQRVAQLS